MNLRFVFVKYLLIALLALFVGCSTIAPSGVAPKATAAAELETALYAEFGLAGDVADDFYLLPSKAWVNSEFVNAWFGFKKSIGFWTPEENDCDDFSRGAAFLAQVLNHNTPRKPHAGLAFGEFWYRTDAGGNHAINFFVYREDQKLKVGYFEPQLDSQVVLSQKEINSCYEWRL